MIANIGYKAFIVLTYFCFFGLLWVYFVLPELKGLTPQGIDAAFAGEASAEKRARRERIAKELEVHRLATVVAVVKDDVYESNDSMCKQEV